MKKISLNLHIDLHKRVGFWRMVGADPFVDWAIIIALSGLLAAVCVSIGAYVYADNEAQSRSVPSSASSDATGAAASFDSQELYRVTAAFDARTAESVQFEKGYVGPGDPSLP